MTTSWTAETLSAGSRLVEWDNLAVFVVKNHIGYSGFLNQEALARRTNESTQESSVFRRVTIQDTQRVGGRKTRDRDIQLDDLGEETL